MPAPDKPAEPAPNPVDPAAPKPSEGPAAKPVEVAVPQNGTAFLELQRDRATQDRNRLLAEAERFRSLGKEADAQEASVEAALAGKRETRLAETIGLVEALQATRAGLAAQLKSIQTHHAKHDEAVLGLAQTDGLIINNLQVNGQDVPGTFTGQMTVRVIPPVPPADAPVPPVPAPAAQ